MGTPDSSNGGGLARLEEGGGEGQGRTRGRVQRSRRHQGDLEIGRHEPRRRHAYTAHHSYDHLQLQARRGGAVLSQGATAVNARRAVMASVLAPRRVSQTESLKPGPSPEIAIAQTHEAWPPAERRGPGERPPAGGVVSISEGGGGRFFILHFAFLDHQSNASICMQHLNYRTTVIKVSE
jgi:hypothetical protein